MGQVTQQQRVNKRGSMKVRGNTGAQRALGDRGGGFVEVLQGTSARRPRRTGTDGGLLRKSLVLTGQRVSRQSRTSQSGGREGLLRRAAGTGGRGAKARRRGDAGRGGSRQGSGRVTALRGRISAFRFADVSLPELLPSGIPAALGRLFTVGAHPANLPLLVAAFCAVFVLNYMVGDFSELRRYVMPAPQVSMPAPDGDSLLRQSLQPRHGHGGIASNLSVDPERFTRLEVQSYTLVPGDTLSGIANRYDLRMDTLVSFNQIEDVRRLQVGTEFKIPNRDGLLHEVARGETLSGIAADYGTSVNAILDANDLASSTISVGQVLFVPDARMNSTDLKLVLGELFVYPVRGRFTSGFGMRNDPFTGLRRFHNGIDLAGPVGTPIGAAMPGTVVHTETQIGNYGKFVIVRHDAGFQTLYAHLDRIGVRKGQYVSQGQRVGTMGNTGRSTGPHLHFSIIRNGSFVDPLGFLH